MEEASNIIAEAANATNATAGTAMVLKTGEVVDILSNAKKATANATLSAVPENTTDTGLPPDTGLVPDLDYFPPPYSYDECLTVFSKESCDFRFNG